MACHLCAYRWDKYAANYQPLPVDSPVDQHADIGTCEQCSVHACSVHSQYGTAFHCAYCYMGANITVAVVGTPSPPGGPGGGPTASAEFRAAITAPFTVGVAAGLASPRFAKGWAAVAPDVGYADHVYDAFDEEAFREALDLVRTDVHAMLERRSLVESRFDPQRWLAFLVARLDEDGAALWMPTYEPDDEVAHALVVRRTIADVASRIGGEGIRLLQSDHERGDPLLDLADAALVDALEAAGTDAVREQHDEGREWSGRGLPPPWRVDSPQLVVPMAWNLGVAYLEIATGRREL